MPRMMMMSLTVLCCVGAASIAGAFPVKFAAGLDELIQEADLICKAVVVSVDPVTDPWFDKVQGYEPYSATLRIISSFKGSPSSKEIEFHFYGESKKEVAVGFWPQTYHLLSGQTYIIFAKQSPAKGIYRQLWKNASTKQDQGVILAANQEPREGKSVGDVLWAELTGLLQSKHANDIVYAVRQLDDMSGGAPHDHADFDRAKVLKTIIPLIRSQHEEVAKAAILALGSRNPYLSDDNAAPWLASVGHGDIAGYMPWRLDKEYLGGKLFWKELAAIADGDSCLAVRAVAIRAMGRSHQLEVFDLANRWVKSPTAEIRQAATLLLADFPDRTGDDTLRSLAKDPSPLVRRSAALAIGYGQFVRLVPVLGELLRDPQVASAAALALLSFPLKQNREVLEGNIKHADYMPLFVNALARENPQPYFRELCEIIRTGRQPKNWWGGQIPWTVSWDILFKCAQGRTAVAWKDGEFDAVLDVLEYPASGAKRPTYCSSSEPRDLYALYVQRGLTDRAKKFRAACKKTIPYDIDYFFNMVDQNPNLYQRE